VSDRRSPLTRAREGALDVVLYGPVGLLVAIGEKMPELARDGREEVSKRVQLYRMVGQMAVRHGQTEVSARFARAQRRGAPVEPLALEPGSVSPAGGRDRLDAHSDALAESLLPSTSTAQSAPVAPQPPPEPPPAVPSAIADYDSLAASQVVARLPSLTEAELEAVRRYEEHHRGRRTILGRIQQLQTAA
jgi:hypothetical protein